MSAELLLRAAADMRALAEAATPGPWWAAVGQGPKRRLQQTALVGRADMRGQGEKGCIAVLAGPNGRRADDAEHIASWGPEVALAVAAVLEHEAAIEVQYGASASTLAIAVAAAYLGEDAPESPLSSRRRADAGTPSSSTRASETAAGQGTRP